MVLWNFLDGGPSHNGPLVRPSKSMRGGTLGTNPRQQPLSAWKVVIPGFYAKTEYSSYA
jgi:hypothetical protein